LVEFGHQKKGGGFVAPKPFMRPAFEAAKDEARKIYGDDIGGAIHRHFKRQRRSGRI
jgi:hypothetical protein